MSENPFESTSNAAAYEAMVPDADLELAPPRSKSRIITYWTAICTVSAIPSFILGLEVSGRSGIPAMLVGVLLFIVAYVLVDIRYLDPLLRTRRNFRTALLWGFGLRATASLIVPAGFMLDMFPGILSVGIVNLLLGGETLDGGQRLSGFFAPLLTTVLQGTFMNGLLWPLILVLYAALNYFRGKDRLPT